MSRDDNLSNQRLVFLREQRPAPQRRDRHLPARRRTIARPLKSARLRMIRWVLLAYRKRKLKRLIKRNRELDAAIEAATGAVSRRRSRAAALPCPRGFAHADLLGGQASVCSRRGRAPHPPFKCTSRKPERLCFGRQATRPTEGGAARRSLAPAWSRLLLGGLGNNTRLQV